MDGSLDEQRLRFAGVGGGKYDPSNWYFQNPRTGANDYVYNFGAEPCNWEKNVSNAGSDTRAMYIKMSIKARVDWRGDKWVRIGWRLSPNGTHEVLYANTQDA